MSTVQTKPVRIQLQRRKGWRMPPNTVVVSRPSDWGNPFAVGAVIERDSELWSYVSEAIPGIGNPVVGGVGFSSVRITSAQMAVDLFSCWFLQQVALSIRAFEELPGESLACWCRLPGEGQPDICHGAWLLGCVNGEDSGV